MKRYPHCIELAQYYRPALWNTIPVVDFFFYMFVVHKHPSTVTIFALSSSIQALCQ